MKNSRYSLSVVPHNCLPTPVQEKFTVMHQYCDAHGFYGGYDNLITPMEQGQKSVTRLYHGKSNDEMILYWQRYYCQTYPELKKARLKAEIRTDRMLKNFEKAEYDFLQVGIEKVQRF